MVKIKSTQIKSFGVVVIKGINSLYLEVSFGRTRYLIGF